MSAAAQDMADRHGVAAPEDAASVYPENSRDGKVHLAYYRHAETLSFVWDGESREIEVSYGGYGEKVIATISLHDVPTPTGGFHGVMRWFYRVCDTFADDYAGPVAK